MSNFSIVFGQILKKNQKKSGTTAIILMPSYALYTIYIVLY